MMNNGGVILNQLSGCSDYSDNYIKIIVLIHRESP